MTRSDEAAVSRLLCACYRLLGRTENLGPEAVDFLLSKRGSVESIRKEAEAQAFLVAEGSDGIEGMVAVDENKIAKLYVAPLRHGRGVGRALFHAAEVLIKQGGYSSLTLGSSPSAIGFYRAMGAMVTGRKRLERGPLAGHAVVLMRKDLPPI
jgi:GNAT superfamily N-acetyltransferase